jgi:hypothetical protein
MTTVGYGDVYPLTSAGQLIASVTMMFGILILALPITVIGSNFGAEYEDYLRRQKVRLLVATRPVHPAPSPT